MFFKKLVFGALGGGALGIIMMVTSLFQGKSFSEAGEMLMGSIMLGVIVVFWCTRDKGGNDQGGSIGRDVSRLRRDLQTYHRAVADCAAKGDDSGAAYYRSQISVVESELRSLGA